METPSVRGYPVLIIGAGRGGAALLEMFLEDSLVKVIAIADKDPEAPGIKLAKDHRIPTFSDPAKALRACRKHPDCIVYNLSHDDTIVEEARKVFGDKRVSSGPEVMLFWQMVTNLKKIKGELEKSHYQLQSIILNVMDGIIMINETGEIQGFNPAAEEIFGYSQPEALGKNLKMLMPEPNRGRHDGYLRRYLETGHSKILGVRGREVVAARKSGEEFPLEMSVSEMVLGGHRYFIGITRDITDRKRAEKKIAHLAHYDYLTDLPNRALFVDMLNHSIALAKRNKRKAAVLFLDLDGFKKINDALGHDAGDLLLKDVASRFKTTIRASDSVARVGGDEFVFVLDNIESEESAALVAKKILIALAEPFDMKGQHCSVGGSIGIAMYPEGSRDPEKLIQQADEAMYLAKQSGKNTWKFYREVLQNRLEQ
ncbi:MAG: diguanylate cyclase [Gammaproteobacteria bacterium]|nr:diguanylate cyclase [Gammaproteobacteria bacterium]MBU1480088.1 diguanylate cyclase [Gammaproteobacteria bacterium]